MHAETNLIRVKYNYAKLERDALELAHGCEAGAREALLELAARYREEAQRDAGAHSRKSLAICTIATSFGASVSYWIHQLAKLG